MLYPTDSGAALASRTVEPASGQATLASAVDCSKVAVGSMNQKGKYMSNEKAGIASTAAGGVAGIAGSVGTVAAAGSVTGLGAAGITSGLAAVGSIVGGGMAAGLAVVAAAPIAAAGAGYGIFRVVKRVKNGHWG